MAHQKHYLVVLVLLNNLPCFMVVFSYHTSETQQQTDFANFIFEKKDLIPSLFQRNTVLVGIL